MVSYVLLGRTMSIKELMLLNPDPSATQEIFIGMMVKTEFKIVIVT